MAATAVMLGATKSVAPALMWLGGLIIAVVILGLIILKVRAATLARDSRGAGQEGLLEGLRRMRDQGQISRDEYDAARKNLVARAAAGDKPAPAPGLPRPTPAREGEVRSRPGFDLTGAPLPERPSQDSG